MKIYKNLFDQICSLENIFTAWEEFRRGKSKKPDVQRFEFTLEQNLFSLCEELKNKSYAHGAYSGFYIRDPKARHIHKAAVRDRVLHHAMFKILHPIFEKEFIAESFSCRVGKGTHRGVAAVETMIRRESKNYTRPCFVLKCDVRRFFDSVDHGVLLAILRKRIKDAETMWLLKRIIDSFSSREVAFGEKIGLPIGNLTSQLFANVYMNEFDQFVKHKLRVKHYARYTDDFVAVSADKAYLEWLVWLFAGFLHDRLKLSLHPNKVFIRKVNRGIDFLGYVLLPHCRVLRNKTKRRVFRKLRLRAHQFCASAIDYYSFNQSLRSYLGALSHANAYHLRQDLQNMYCRGGSV